MNLRCALVGCGVIAPTHLDAINAYDGADVVALCDPRRERMQKLAKKCPDAALVEDYHDLLDREKIDAICILTEHDNHTNIARAALSAGISVLCEKPVASSRDQIDSLVAALSELDDSDSAPIAGGVFQHRFEARVIALKQAFESGILGTGLTLSIEHRCLRTAEYYNSDAWRGTLEREGGSILINQSIHFVDLFRFIIGEIATVSCFTANLTHGDLIETEDTAVASFKFKTGMLGNLTCTASSECDQWNYRITLVSSKATVVLTNGEMTISASDDIEEEIERFFANATDIAGDVNEKEYYGGGHRGNIWNFLDALAGRNKLEISLFSAAVSTAVVHALYESNQKGCVVAFNAPYISTKQ